MVQDERISFCWYQHLALHSSLKSKFKIQQAPRNILDSTRAWAVADPSTFCLGDTAEAAPGRDLMEKGRNVTLFRAKVNCCISRCHNGNKTCVLYS